MIDVFIERRLPQPLQGDDMAGIAAAMAGCLDIHRVSWCASLLSADGHELFCHFRGPDAESVRIAVRQSGGPPGANAWSCQVQDAPDLQADELAGVTAIVVHAFDTPAQFGARELHEVADMGCFQLHRVRRLRSYLSGDGLRMVALYQAPDAESLRIVQRLAGLPADRVVAVRRFAP